MPGFTEFLHRDSFQGAKKHFSTLGSPYFHVLSTVSALKQPVASWCTACTEYASMPNFTEEEKAQLARYVTNTDDGVFAITNLQGIVGAVYARYSRAQGGFRETLLKEFMKDGVV